MLIRNHRLVCDASDAIDFKLDLQAFKFGIAPSAIVLHYGVTHSLSATVAAQKAQGFLAHLTADGFAQGELGVYQLTQLLPFNARGQHAGVSNYAGVTSWNGHSIGIEIANPGPLLRGSDGVLRTTYRKVWSEDDAIQARHQNPACPYEWWAKFSQQEIDLLTKVCVTLVKAYPITYIVGHDEISPGRKIDPGPAFPMEEFRKNVWALSKL